VVVFRRGGWEPPKQGVECRWGRQTSRCSTNIWRVVNSVLRLTLSWRHSSVISGVVCWSRETNDEVLMTISLNVTPKTTEHHLIVRN